MAETKQKAYRRPGYVTTITQSDPTVTFSTAFPCEHSNGWWQTIPRWWWRVRVYCCSDCMNILEADTMKKL